jgi:hypothetical protein
MVDRALEPGASVSLVIHHHAGSGEFGLDLDQLVVPDCCSARLRMRATWTSGAPRPPGRKLLPQSQQLTVLDGRTTAPWTCLLARVEERHQLDLAPEIVLSVAIIFGKNPIFIKY